MIPWQIYCDYLEDKGFDTRLLRTEEPGGIIVTYVFWDDFTDMEDFIGDVGDGMGFGVIGLNNGNGRGYGPNSVGGGRRGNGIGYGYGNLYGDCDVMFI